MQMVDMAQVMVSPVSRWVLPPVLADALRRELVHVADEVVEEIRRGVAEFDRPLHGTFATGIRLGVEQALVRFLDLITDPDGHPPADLDIPRELARGEFREGRNLDALQAAYRIGARTVWRSFASIGMRCHQSAETMCALADALFAYIDEVSDQSARAFAELTARNPHGQRRRLLELLVHAPQSESPRNIARLAAECCWSVPERVACVALAASWRDGPRLSPAVSPDVLMNLEDPDPLLLVPDADGPGREEMLLRALGDSEFVIGPTVELADAALSLRLARQTLILCRRGIIASDPPVYSADHLPTLLMLSDEGIVDLMIRDEYALLAQMPPIKRERLAETLMALLDGCTTPEIAIRLHVHPQTVRYRLRRLHALYGDRLYDPDWRFSMQIVLRIRAIHDQ